MTGDLARDMPDTDVSLFTIGHSSHRLDRFLALLTQHRVNAVADVRSSPYSRLYPHFNRESLQRSLAEHGVAYVDLGPQLGARPNDPACYQHGRVVYRRLASTDAFKQGLARVLNGARQHRLALLCAEQEPLVCHRAILVARELQSLGATVSHIHPDGRLEPHVEAESRLLSTFGLQENGLFLTRQEILDDAYSRQEQRIAFVDDDPRVRPTGDPQ